jgi:hypothetical protein
LAPPSHTAAVTFKAVVNEQILQSQGNSNFTLAVEKETHPFTFTGINPSTIEIDPKEGQYQTVEILGTGLINFFHKDYCYIIGPKRIKSVVFSISETALEIEIPRNEVSSFGKYRFILTKDDDESYLVPFTLTINQKITVPKLELLDATPDELSPGDNFVLQVSKDTQQNDWDEVQVENISIKTETGQTVPVEHAVFNAISNTEASINCTVPSDLKITGKTNGEITLTAAIKGKSCQTINNLEIKLKPNSGEKTFTMTGCAPMRVKRGDVQNPNLRFSIMGTNLDQITALRIGYTYQMAILSKTPNRIQCKFLTTSIDIPEGVYRFTAKYTDPETGTEEQKIVQNVRITIFSE